MKKEKKVSFSVASVVCFTVCSMSSIMVHFLFKRACVVSFVFHVLCEFNRNDDFIFVSMEKKKRRLVDKNFHYSYSYRFSVIHSLKLLIRFQPKSQQTMMDDQCPVVQNTFECLFIQSKCEWISSAHMYFIFCPLTANHCSLFLVRSFGQ